MVANKYAFLQITRRRFLNEWLFFSSRRRHTTLPRDWSSDVCSSDLLRREYSLNQVEYCRNFIFRRNFPIHKIFERSAELGVFCLTADKIAQLFGVRKHKRLRGKLHSMLERLDHGHHVLRIYCKSLVARLYEKFSTFLRLEICVNRLKDLGLNKGLKNLDALRKKLLEVTDRLAGIEGE